MHGANRLTLDATITERGDLRYTPSGLPAIDCLLRHASMQTEAGGERKVECEVTAVAFGEVALALAKLPVSTAVNVEGFLARRWRTGTSLALHVVRCERIFERD